MPMTVESYAPGGRDPQSVPASRVVILDDQGNPILVAVELADGTYHAAHVLDPDFDRIVQTFGYAAPRVGRVVSAGRA